ncbi:Cullin-1 [Trichinella spiralis]|uniref:Cullin-1 n=1 Tax=Trichinella spiralis TaxID=6334 RepID=A0A0V1BVJ7_TRISP|nr:Cullin-1 [Trichinella spiralis]
MNDSTEHTQLKTHRRQSSNNDNPQYRQTSSPPPSPPYATVFNPDTQVLNVETVSAFKTFTTLTMTDLLYYDFLMKYIEKKKILNIFDDAYEIVIVIKLKPEIKLANYYRKQRDIKTSNVFIAGFYDVACCESAVQYDSIMRKNKEYFNPLIFLLENMVGYSNTILPGSATNIDILWADLKDGMEQIYSRTSMCFQRYMNIYTHVYTYSTAIQSNSVHSSNSSTAVNGSCHSAQRGRVISAHSPATNINADANITTNATPNEFSGHELYSRIATYLHSFVADLHKLKKQNYVNNAASLHDESLLVYYCTQWENYRFSSKIVNGLCAYLNRHWIRRINDEGNDTIVEIYQLALRIWKKVFFEILSDSLTKALLKAVECLRHGEMCNMDLVSGVVNSFVELSSCRKQSNRSLEDDTVDQSLMIYKKYFEEPFLMQTRAFYTIESETFIRENTFSEYMKRVETRMQEENKLCTVYLNKVTLKPLSNLLVDIFVEQRLDVFQAEFKKLLKTEKTEGRTISAFVREQTDPKTYVTAILEVYEKFHILVTDAFRGDYGFVTALDKACSKFINDNKITKKANCSSKSPELLARYCDILLKKSPKNPEEAEVESLLNKVMVVFKFIEDKDIFQKFYIRLFAKRLVNQLSASEDTEASMISKLKEACGFEYTSKLQRMFTDIAVSKSITDRFHEYEAKCKIEGVQTNVMVLSSGAWPFQASFNFNIPAPVETYTGRKLSWLFNCSRVEMAAHCYDRNYTLLTSAYQAAVLEQFNYSPKCMLLQLFEATNIRLDLLQQVIGQLIKFNVLGAKIGDSVIDVKDSNDDGEDALGFDSVIFLGDFRSRKVRVDLTKVSLKAEISQEHETVEKNVDEDRRLLIQACIVRTMKMRKALNHNQLISEVISQLSSRFTPRIQMIKFFFVFDLFEPEVVKFVGKDLDRKMGSVLWLVVLVCVQWIGALDELLEPTLLISVLVRNKAHVLPYFLGTLDALDYPKHRIQLFIRLDHSVDDSAEMLDRWLGRVNRSYHSVEFSHDDDPIGYAGERSWFDWTEDRYREVIRWKQYALDKGRRVWADYLLFLDSDVLFTDPNAVRLLIAESKPIVAPMLTSVGAYSNFWASTTDTGYYKRTDDYDRLLTRQSVGCFAVPMVNSAVLIDLRWQATDKLALEPDRLVEPYNGPLDDMLLLAASVRQAGLRMHVSNRHRYGVLLPPLDVDASLADELDNLQFLVLESLHNGPPGLTTTPLLEATEQPVPGPVDKMHFDELYLINLLRRPDRRLRMLACFAVLGLEVRLVEAVDGRMLEPADLNAIGVKQMPDYRDPYHKRPMTLGEVGCFLSHYNVWRDMLDRGYRRAVIFEDDLRFTRSFRRQVGVVMAELDANVPDWDLVYLGRKRLNPDQDGPLVENCSFVSHVGYSYWTLAYALSRRRLHQRHREHWHCWTATAAAAAAADFAHTGNVSQHRATRRRTLNDQPTSKLYLLLGWKLIASSQRIERAICILSQSSSFDPQRRKVQQQQQR